MNYTAIADDIAANEGINPANASTAFARMSAETKDVDIPSADIMRYLMLNDKWLPIKEAADNASKAAVEALSIFDSFQISAPTTGALVKVKLGEVMDALVTATMIEPADKAVIMAMGDGEKWPNLDLADVEEAIRRRIG